MPNLKQTLVDYLRRIGQYEPQSLGKESRRLTAEDNVFLRESLNRQLRFNNLMILVALVLLCALFILGVFLILYNLRSVNVVEVISGATFAAMLAMIRFLRRLWLDKSAVDLLIHASYAMSPEEAAKLVTSFYFRTQNIRGQVKAELA